MKLCLCGCNFPVNNKFIRGHSNKIRIGKTIEEIYGKEKAIKIKLELKKEKTKRNITQEQIEKERLVRLKSKDRLSLYGKNWRLKNRENSKQYKLIKRQKDIHFKILENLRARIGKAVERKSNKTKTLIGCNINELQQYLEKQFKNGMNWNNYGKDGWHIDHIIPCAKFDLIKEEEQLKCFHYSNLQPLWAKENIIKGGKLQ